MSNRLYFDQQNKLFVVLSYAGGTKYFRHLTEERLPNFIPVDAKSLSPAQCKFDVIQVVRDPMSRYMSWFDKQYIKPMYKDFATEFKVWVNQLMTKEWVDSFFKTATIECHYDGHTNFQSVWPKHSMPGLYRDDWRYLRMEDIQPFFFGEEKFDPFRDPKQYVGVWEVLHSDTKEYVLDQIKTIYAQELEWYDNLDFIQPK